MARDKKQKMTAEEGFASLHGIDSTQTAGRLSENVDKLADLGLGLGAHLIKGWRGQFERMERFYNRYVQSDDKQDALDNALTFFIYAHSLREWIIEWEQIEKSKFDANWSQIVIIYPEMKVTRDICNVTKHLKLSHSPSVDKHFALFWAYDPFVDKKSQWVIYVGERRMTLGNLMYQVLTGWRQFIRQLDID